MNQSDLKERQSRRISEPAFSLTPLKPNLIKIQTLDDTKKSSNEPEEEKKEDGWEYYYDEEYYDEEEDHQQSSARIGSKETVPSIY